MPLPQEREATVHTPSGDVGRQRPGEDENALKWHAGPSAERGMREDLSRLQ